MASCYTLGWIRVAKRLGSADSPLPIWLRNQEDVLLTMSGELRTTGKGGFVHLVSGQKTRIFAYLLVNKHLNKLILQKSLALAERSAQKDR